MEDDSYDVYVDAKILGRHDPLAQKDAFVAYVVKGMKEPPKAMDVNVEETDDAEYRAILFAIHELKGKSKKLTIFCDHQSVVSETTNRDFKDTPTTNPLLREVRKELDNPNSNIILTWLEKNPAHTFLNEYVRQKRTTF